MDEDGVDVVEAIDAWIDEEIDDLTDDELEVILEILDAVSESSLANVDASDVYDDDIADLVELVGGSVDDRGYTNRVLRAALFDDPFVDSSDVSESAAATQDQAAATALDVAEVGEVDEPALDSSDVSERTAATQDQAAATALDVADSGEVDEPALDDTDDHEPDDDGHGLDRAYDDDTELEDDDARDHDDDTHDADNNFDLADDEHDPDNNLDLADDEHDPDNNLDLADDTHDNFLSDLADAEGRDREAIGDVVGHDDFLADLQNTRSAPASQLVRPVELREFDELGPSFLTETPVAENRSRRRSRRRLGDILLPLFMIAGLAAFGFGMVQLIDSLNEGDPATAVAAGGVTPVATATSEPTPVPTEVPATPAPVDPSAPPPTATPEPPPAPRIGVRLVTGDVMIVAFPERDAPPEVSQLYDVADEELAPAREIAWLDQSLGIVDNDGNVLIVDPDSRRPQPRVIYESGGGLGEAVKIAAVGAQVAILTDDGDISLTATNGRADPDVIQLVWDAEEEGAKATDLSSIDGLVPFVLDDGNAQMIVTSEDNAVVPIWVADDQPPAFNVGGSVTGILLGVGQGAVARYNLGAAADAEVLESVWDPFTREDEPAIGYSSAGDGTAVVTGNGAIVLADESGGGPVLWDPEVTEIRAFVALGTDAALVVLLETGSVVRIPLDSDQLIESIWDITDETLSAANQVVVEPSAAE